MQARWRPNLVFHLIWIRRAVQLSQTGYFFLFAGYDALNGLATRIVSCSSVIPNWILSHQVRWRPNLVFHLIWVRRAVQLSQTGYFFLFAGYDALNGMATRNVS